MLHADEATRRARAATLRLIQPRLAESVARPFSPNEYFEMSVDGMS